MTARQQFEMPVILDEITRLRIETAARIAGGMLGNGESFNRPSWEARTASDAVRVADNILNIVLPT